MNNTEEEFLKDNGFKSRKFLLTLLGVIFITALGLIFGFWGLAEGVLSAVLTSLVTIILGYSGISVGRSIVPKVLKEKNKTRETTVEKKNLQENKEGV